jgi:gliding motility-associated-like protein
MLGSKGVGIRKTFSGRPTAYCLLPIAYFLFIKTSLIGNKVKTKHLTAYCLLLIAYFLCLNTTAQTLLNAEYFFNTDPGIGNATPITLAANTGTLTFTTNIPTSSLSQGFHQLAIRVKETGGRWSNFESRGFYITAATSDAANITAAEYFFDTDPGIGSGTPIPVTPGATTNFTVSVPTSSLAAGFHFLAIRTKGADGKWGLFEGRGFYITASTTDVPNLVAAEYFFDADPGFGNGTAIPITSGATSNFIASIPTGSLTPGFHFVAIRTKAANGKWGIFESRGFYIAGSTTDVPNITNAEYFFDTDPGQGNGTSISITPGAISNFTVSLPSTGLSQGFHFLAIRTQRADGTWGIFESRGFYVSGSASNTSDIVAAEYFIDGIDPGEGNGEQLTVNTPGPAIDQVFDFALNGVPSGARTLSVRVKDASGIWSQISTQPFNVLACTPPSLPTATGASRCNSGTVTLNGTGGAIGTQVYRWYADASSATILFTGAAFTTPAINSTTDFFVSVFDPATLCESNRVAVTATVISTSPPLLNITNATICEGNSIKISAPTGFTTYLWSNGETTREIVVTASGSYTVVAGDGTCESQPSLPASIIVSARPAKPVVSSTGSTSLCDGSSVTLSAPAGFTYVWSDGRTLQDIVVNASGNYSVVVTDGSGCSSESSHAITVTANTTPAKPIIDVFGSTALCGTNTVGLLAPSGFSIYQWSGGQTTQGLTVSTAGSFSVIVGNASNCLSVASDVITVTSTGQPCTTTGGTNSPPVITATTLSVQIEGLLETDLTEFISDPDNNVDFTSLRVINNQTSKGIAASIDASYNLIIDYEGNAFTGNDRVTIEVCDLAGVCAQQIFDIDVTGGVEVFNGITPDGDGLNDFLFIKYIDVIEGALNNKVTILNRWGDVVFEINNYDNLSNIFAGQTNSGKDLPSGTYFYKLEFQGASSAITGFITLKR